MFEKQLILATLERHVRKKITDKILLTINKLLNHEPQTTANTCHEACSINVLSHWPREPGKHQDRGQLWHTNMQEGLYISTCFENQSFLNVYACVVNHFEEIIISRCFGSLVITIVVHVAVEGF